MRLSDTEYRTTAGGRQMASRGSGLLEQLLALIIISIPLLGIADLQRELLHQQYSQWQLQRQLWRSHQLEEVDRTGYRNTSGSDNRIFLSTGLQRQLWRSQQLEAGDRTGYRNTSGSDHVAAVVVQASNRYRIET